ncbi:MAG: hypothetical protein QME57_04545 [Patescibacteria group bacterium]|nr:hypothetical protein [Patescibacteria group bacterium]
MMSTYWAERWRGGSKWSEAKIVIAHRIVEKYLEEGDSVILDAGSSLAAIAEVMYKTRAHINKRLTILTHNMGAFEILNPKDEPPQFGYNLLLAGGRYDRDLNALFGPQTETAYDTIHPKKIIIGVSGIRFDEGLYCHGNTEELAVKQILFAKQVIHRVIVCDYLKIGVQDALCFGRMSEILNAASYCSIVTNAPESNTPKEIKDRFEEQKEKLRSLFPSVKLDIVEVS